MISMISRKQKIYFKKIVLSKYDYRRNLNLIDYDKAKLFWNSRVNKISVTGKYYIANLSDQIPDYAALKDRIERRKLFKLLKKRNVNNVLDLGCGVGRLTFFFARHCKKVVAVDFSDKFIDIVEDAILKKHIRNIHTLVADVSKEKLVFNEKFDLIFIGGLFTCVDDQVVLSVLNSVRDNLSQHGVIIFRESIRYRERVELNDEFVKELGSNYSATYRTPQEYESLLNGAGYRLINRFPLHGHYIGFHRLCSLRLLIKLFLNIYEGANSFLEFIKRTKIVTKRYYTINAYDQLFFVGKKA